MEKNQSKLDELKGKNPFKVPNGYFEGLTEQIMAQLPEASSKETKVVSMLDRFRPWLYLAGVFAGLLVLARVFFIPVPQETDDQGDDLYLHALVSEEDLQIVLEDDLEFLEFIENQYLDRIFVEEIDDFDDMPSNLE